MNDWRTLPVNLLVALAFGLVAAPAMAQSSTPLNDTPETHDDDAPQSPAEEAARRQAQLGALFENLAQPDNAAWESDQGEIWAMWSRSGSPSMDLLLMRAATAMDQHDFSLALKFLNDLVRLAPDFPEGWNKRATVYFLLEDYGRSISDIQRTLALEPRHFGAISGLGIILERLGDKPGAMRVFRRGLAIHPNLPGASAAVERLSPEVDGRRL